MMTGREYLRLITVYLSDLSQQTQEFINSDNLN